MIKNFKFNTEDDLENWQLESDSANVVIFTRPGRGANSFDDPIKSICGSLNVKSKFDSNPSNSAVYWQGTWAELGMSDPVEKVKVDYFYRWKHKMKNKFLQMPNFPLAVFGENEVAVGPAEIHYQNELGEWILIGRFSGQKFARARTADDLWGAYPVSPFYEQLKAQYPNEGDEHLWADYPLSSEPLSWGVMLGNNLDVPEEAQAIDQVIRIKIFNTLPVTDCQDQGQPGMFANSFGVKYPKIRIMLNETSISGKIKGIYHFIRSFILGDPIIQSSIRAANRFLTIEAGKRNFEIKAFNKNVSIKSE